MSVLYQNNTSRCNLLGQWYNSAYIDVSFNFVVFYIFHFFADQMLEFVCVFFLYASFVIYIYQYQYGWDNVGLSWSLKLLYLGDNCIVF
jgi:hypothetical protein